MLNELKNNKKFYVILVTATLVASALFFIFLYKMPVNNYTLPVNEATPDIGRMEADGYYFDDMHADEITEPNQKIFFNIPTAVKKGSYTLSIYYRSGAGSTLSVCSPSNPNAVKCDRVSLNHLPKDLPGDFNMNYGLDFLPGYQTSEIYITKDVSDLDIYAVYCGFQYFHIESVELIGNRKYIKTIFPVFFLIILLIDAALILCKLDITPKNNTTLRRILIITGIALVSSIPLIFSVGLLFDDGHFLYARFNGIRDGLLDGQFPVRIHPNTLKGFGYAVPYFYPELFLYPFGIMRVIGYSLRFVMYTMLFTMNLVTAFISFYSFRKISKNDHIASVSTFLYVFSLYRLVDVYSRGSVSEVLAIMFLPLIVSGLYEILVNNGSIIPLTIGITGLINSHILSCEMVILFVVLLCIPCFKIVFKKNSFLKLLSSAGISALLSLYFIIPFLHMSTTDKFRVYASNAYETSDNMLSFTDIFSISTSAIGKTMTGSLIENRYSLGIVMMALSLASFVAACMLYKKINSSDTLKIKTTFLFSVICFVFGVISIILSSAIFPWEKIEDIGGIVRTVFCMVQFPWRYLSMASVFFTFSVCGCLAIIKYYCDSASCEKKQPDSNATAKINHAYTVPIIALISCVLIFTQACCYFATLFDVASDEYLIYDGSAISKHGCTGMGEYEPVDFTTDGLDHSIEELQYVMNESAVINPTDGSNSGLTISGFSKSGTEVTLLIINPTDSDQILYLPYVYYNGYTVSNIADDPSGNNLTPGLLRAENGTIALSIPSGYYNGAHITYKEPTLYRIAELMSLLSIFGTAVLLIKKRAK